MVLLGIKILLWIIALLVNAVLSQKLYENLNKGIERAFYNSQIDHIMYIKKSRSISAFCTVVFIIILIFTSLSISLIN